MEAPIVAMDEFDIFMDEANRKISTELLLKSSMDRKDRQSIFLTPQNLSHIKADPRVKMIVMKPARERQSQVSQSPTI